MNMNLKKLVGLGGVMILAAGLVWISGISQKTAPDRPAQEVSTGLVSPAWADPPVPDCPAIFAICDNTFARRCNFSTMCTTTNTNEKKCKKPDGSIFQCTGAQKIHVQNCPCREVFHNTCCDDDTCGPCPLCESQPGSQTYFCI
jgi:hypothetical protein